MQTQHDKHVAIGGHDRGIDHGLDGCDVGHVMIRRKRHNDAIGRAISDPERSGSHRCGGVATHGLQKHFRRDASGRELLVNEITVISRPHHQHLAAGGNRLC
jgi:hypothetical protein